MLGAILLIMDCFVNLQGNNYLIQIKENNDISEIGSVSKFLNMYKYRLALLLSL